MYALQIKKVADGQWEIYKNGSVVAEIQSHWRYGKTDGKTLYMNGSEICEVTSQKDAIEKVKTYLKELYNIV